jgi:uncharacterized protein
MKTSRFALILSACGLFGAHLVPVMAAPKSVLVVTVTTGFRHSCIPLSEEVFRDLAHQSGQFTVDFVSQPMPRSALPPRPPRGESPEQKEALRLWQEQEKAWKADQLPAIAEALQKLSPERLKNYDAVVFANTTGDLPLPDKQGFVDWIEKGGGFAGIHAATDTFHGFPAFVEMIGGEFLTHGPQVEVDCLNQDPAHAAVSHLPARWTVFDEIYLFKNYDPMKVRDLLVLDNHPNNKEPGHFPISWCKPFGQGRVFYTSLGHREDMWDPNYSDAKGRKNDPAIARAFQAHVMNGVLWALGLAPGSAELPQK